MAVIVLCSRLLLNVLLLLVEHAQRGGFLHIIPNRLQHFEYESISFTCNGFDGSAKWIGVRNIEEFIPTCSNMMSAVTCTIYNAFEADSGEYWCETGGGERSNTVNIIVTGGSVILESPVFPVMEGDDVTLCCRKKATLLNQTAEIYKDGLFIGTAYRGEMTIHNVTKSDEGLYKCSISGDGESPEIWLTVNNFTQQNEEVSVILESPALPVSEGDAVTLCCRKKAMTLENCPAVFFKDGLFIGTNSTGNLTIHSVFKSHEGLYKCNISRAAESPESRLTVRELHRETCLCSDHSCHIYLVLRTVFTIVIVALLLLLVGLLQCGKLGGTHKDPLKDTRSRQKIEET